MDKPKLSTNIDRRSLRRGDEAYLTALASAPDTRFLVLDVGDPLVWRVSAGHGDGLSVWFSRDQAARAVTDDMARCLTVFLGVGPAAAEGSAEAGRFALALPEGGRDRLAEIVPLEPPAGLRSLMTAGVVPPDDLAAAGLARSLFAWQSTAKFCSACGSGTRVIDGGWRVRCTGCERDAYPRVDPVVIMLVTDGERCVLAHEPKFPERMFSCIAGYVEPGEDVAEAVARETAEELGLIIGEVAIVDTQPWPFPHSLMIGCVARVAGSLALRIDPVEIVEARWFTRAQAQQLIDRTHPDGLWEPGHQAIAHRLIARFARGEA